ncbi:hypothetical protein Hanom_Chr08g00754441 [Helianthus anomalus]
MLAGREKREIRCGDWSTASPPATIVLYLDLWYLLRFASLCVPRSTRTMAMLCRLDPLSPPFGAILFTVPFCSSNPLGF